MTKRYVAVVWFEPFPGHTPGASRSASTRDPPAWPAKVAAQAGP
jgi:hypothetical protein